MPYEPVVLLDRFNIKWIVLTSGENENPFIVKLEEIIAVEKIPTYFCNISKIYLKGGQSISVNQKHTHILISLGFSKSKMEN